MIEIRPLQRLEELHACEQLQKEIWGFEEISVVPHHLLLTTIKNGGVLLGAFEEQGPHPRPLSRPHPFPPRTRGGPGRGRGMPAGQGEDLIGFVYGFPGIENNRLKHCSLMCAVVSEHRFQGVGYELKLKQREAVLAQEIELITWTFDPLVSSNAYFNLHKLGVISNRYERDLYGDMRDRLNAGLETDRLTVEWWINSPRVQSSLTPSSLLKEKGNPQPVPLPSRERVQGEGRGGVGGEVINQTEERDGFLVNRDYSLKHTEPSLLLEIPYRWREMREQHIELVKEWRQVTRAIFEHYFAQNYYASDFLVIEHAGQKRAFYLLEQATREELLKR